VDNQAVSYLANGVQHVLGQVLAHNAIQQAQLVGVKLLIVLNMLLRCFEQTGQRFAPYALLCAAGLIWVGWLPPIEPVRFALLFPSRVPVQKGDKDRALKQQASKQDLHTEPRCIAANLQDEVEEHAERCKGAEVLDCRQGPARYVE